MIIISIFFTCSPQAKSRVELWGDLNDIAYTMCGPWIVAGEFNVILSKEEKSGESRQAVGCKKFGAWIRD